MTPQFFRTAVGLYAILGAAPSVYAQNYPTRPVRVIVTFAAGGVAYLQTRIVAAKLGELWHTSVAVANRPGAGGNIMLTCNFATHGLNPAAYRTRPYDPLKDFAAVGMIGTAPSILAVHPSLPSRSVSELIAYAKALDRPDTRQRLTEQGMDARSMTPVQFDAFMRAALAKWAKVAQAIGMKLV